MHISRIYIRCVENDKCLGNFEDYCLLKFEIMQCGIYYRRFGGTGYLCDQSKWIYSCDKDMRCL